MLSLDKKVTSTKTPVEEVREEDSNNVKTELYANRNWVTPDEIIGRSQIGLYPKPGMWVISRVFARREPYR